MPIRVAALPIACGSSTPRLLDPPESQPSFLGSSWSGPNKVPSEIVAGAQLKRVPAHVPPDTVESQVVFDNKPSAASPRSSPMAAESDREPPPEMHTPAHGGPKFAGSASHSG